MLRMSYDAFGIYILLYTTLQTCGCIISLIFSMLLSILCSYDACNYEVVRAGSSTQCATRYIGRLMNEKEK